MSVNYFKLNELNLSEDDIKNLDYFKRCEILNNNPVLLARHFQHRLKAFFKDIIIIDGSLGEVKYLNPCRISIC